MKFAGFGLPFSLKGFTGAEKNFVTNQIRATERL